MDQKQHRISLKCLRQFSDLSARPTQTQTNHRLQPFFSPLADSPHIPSRTIILFRFFECHFRLLRLFSCSCPHQIGSNHYHHPNFLTFFHDQLDQEDFYLNSIIVCIGMCPCMPEIASAPTTSNSTSAQIILVHVIIAIASRHYIQGH